MIELRGLHLGNIARSPAESVRPDLWPDHAWVPALGCTGGVLHDLCGGAVGTSASPNWLINDTFGVAGNESSWRFNTQVESVDWSQPWTAVVTCKPFASHADAFPVGCWDQAGRTGGWAIWRDVGDGAVGWSVGYSNASEYLILGNYTVSGGDLLTSTCAAGWLGGTGIDKAFLYADGVEVLGGTKKTVGFATPGVGRVGSLAIAGGSAIAAYGDSRKFLGRVFATTIYYQALTLPQIIELTADPFLPFRRREPAFYSVPSGGGASHSLIAALAGESTTGAATAIIARALAGDVTAASVTGAITAQMVRDLLATLPGQSATGDITATLQRLLLAAVAGDSSAAVTAATIGRALSGTIAGQSATGGVTATLAALIELIASLSGSTTTPAVATTMGRALAATVAGQSTTGSITAQFAGQLLLVAAVAGESTTGDISATIGRTLQAALAGDSATGQVDGTLARAMAATITGASLTGSITAELVSLVSLAASVVGVSVSPSIIATLQRDLAAEVAAGSTTGDAAATIARTLEAAVTGGSLTPDNLVLILTGLGVLHDTAIISRTPRRSLASRTIIRSIQSH